MQPCQRQIEDGMSAVSAYGAAEWIARGSELHCSYCGSCHPKEVFKAIEAGKSITPTDKSFKIYFDGMRKFYFQHFSVEEKKRFIALYNDKAILLNYPGHFYVIPFFM